MGHARWSIVKLSSIFCTIPSNASRVWGTVACKSCWYCSNCHLVKNINGDGYGKYALPFPAASLWNNLLGSLSLAARSPGILHPSSPVSTRLTVSLLYNTALIDISAPLEMRLKPGASKSYWSFCCVRRAKFIQRLVSLKVGIFISCTYTYNRQVKQGWGVV